MSFPSWQENPSQFHLPPPLLSDITLASHIHNRPWKHPGNTDTLGLSIMRRTGPSGWIPSSVQFPNLHTHTNMPSNSRSWPPCTLHSLNSLPGDKKKKKHTSASHSGNTIMPLKEDGRVKQSRYYTKDLSGAQPRRRAAASCSGRLASRSCDKQQCASVAARRRGCTYFPRAKHSSLTVTPLAASTDVGKCTSILGSYSPMTPGWGRGQRRRLCK